MSSRELVEVPRGRWIARCHGPGESPITSGEGSGVRSPSAFKAGEEMADEGESDPARMPVRVWCPRLFDYYRSPLGTAEEGVIRFGDVVRSFTPF